MTDMLKVNRQAALKALELTPTWTLKQTQSLAQHLGESVLEKPVEQAIKLEQFTQTEVPIFAWQSEDGVWLMLTESLSEQEKILIKNIGLALDLRLKMPQIVDYETCKNAQAVIVFGQHLVPYLNALPATITYSLAHLLAHSADKAQTWRDLCAAKSLLQSLNLSQ